jgi:peptide/nickel transport system ATP-binding protein
MSVSALEIKDVCKAFRVGGIIFGKKIMAVDHVNLSLKGDKPWITSIVGESGSGKTTLARIILGLIEAGSGAVYMGGEDITALKRKGLDFYRQVQPIFQNPFSAFSARNTVESYLYETAVNVAGKKNREDAGELIAAALHDVGLDFSGIKGKYPNQFSGGELQRISIARALIPRPKLIVADEPVAMIDASLRMNVVNLFKKLRDEYGINFIYVTHDLSTAYYVSDYIATMYRGNIIEFGNARTILQKPAHPYTRLLLDSVPKVGQKWEQDIILPDIETKEYAEAGCRFAPRCGQATERCRACQPLFYNVENEHQALCWLFEHTQEV